MQIFDALATAAVAPATASALGDHVGAERREVDRCIDRLVRWNIVEPVSRPRDGGEVAYRHTRDSLVTDEEWEQLPVADRRRLTALLLELIEEHAWAAFDRGGWDAADAHLSRLAADLDRQGYDDMVRLTLETLERARDIQAEVVNRRADGTSDGESVKTQLMILHFQDGTEHAGDAPEVTDELLEELHAVAEAIADEAPVEAADLRAVAGNARSLLRLARRLGA
ncbi:MAG: hypothetical protein M3320_02180 [Actinomycetota bacterium]|nr:hypothetical protein [Actinomycetota bacterium]